MDEKATHATAAEQETPRVIISNAIARCECRAVASPLTRHDAAAVVGRV